MTSVARALLWTQIIAAAIAGIAFSFFALPENPAPVFGAFIAGAGFASALIVTFRKVGPQQ